MFIFKDQSKSGMTSGPVAISQVEDDNVKNELFFREV